MIEPGIEAFWAWWPAAAPRIGAAIDERKLDEALVAEITAKVQAVHPKLTWEVGVGVGGTARLAFCLSASGDPELRRLTQRWLQAGPATDAAWEFQPARGGVPALADARLQIAGHTVALADMRFLVALDPGRELMNVTSFHPGFAAMSDEMRGMTTFITLDRILGEDTVQRWLGGIRTSLEPLEKGAPVAVLQEAVGLLSRDATGERFTTLRGEAPDGRPMFATINLALKWIDHIVCDTHVAVDVALLDATPDGMPSDDESEVLNDIEDELEEMITGDAVYFGRETVHGRRSLHWFVAPEHPIRPSLEAWAARHADRDVRLTWSADPRWATADRFR
ncbi:MAG TPA: DUF695 domain-containing protein [Polyangia bacterium]|nr:DUF695 domain-containing protein [Polyangia bacterium]